MSELQHALSEILEGKDVGKVIETLVVANISPTTSQMPGHKQYTTDVIHKRKKKKKGKSKVVEYPK